MAEYELIYRFFQRTLIHEKRYVYTGQNEASLALSYFYEATSRYFENQLANYRHFGLPKPQEGSFRFQAFGRDRIAIYMDDLFLCPKCGSFFFEAETPYIFDLLRNRSESFELGLEAIIASRADVAEFVIAECRQISECNERRMRQEREMRRDERYVAAELPPGPLLRPPKSVYVLRLGDTYKIGVAVDVAMRIKSLQSGCPSSISLVKEWRAADARRYEKLLHARFRKYHVSGEWFSLPKEEVEWLSSLDEKSLQSLDQVQTGDVCC